MQTFYNKSTIEAWQNTLLPRAEWKSYKSEGPDGAIWFTRDEKSKAYIASSCASTMDLAWALANEGQFPESSWVIAQDQFQGRGQFGRKWDSAGGNLYATYRLPDWAGKSGTILPLAIALILADELIDQSLPSRIKWPNDLFIGGKKAGGILVEEKQGRVMAGIGINVNSVPEENGLKHGYIAPVCSLAEFGFCLDAPGLWQKLVKRFKECLADLLAAPEELKDRINQVLAYKAEDVVLEQDNGKSILINISGINFAGGLMIRTPQGTKTIWSGRIIPRVVV